MNPDSQRRMYGAFVGSNLFERFWGCCLTFKNQEQQISVWMNPDLQERAHSPSSRLLQKAVSNSQPDQSAATA